MLQCMGGTCLAESNGSLLPGGWLKVNCGMTACIQGSALDLMLGKSTGKLDLCLYQIGLTYFHNLTTGSNSIIQHV